MSWPVPETMMIEPTESEVKAELDRFCDAMIAIRAEIRAVERGELPRDDNPSSAPRTPPTCCWASGAGPYSKEQAFFPLPSVRDDKYWPPVGRVDNAHGDRNLVCACPPMEDYREAAE
jgi:glycine dehydrogenase